MLRLRPHGSWSGWLSYSWSRAEDRVDGEDVPRSWDQRHAVNLGIVWSKGPWSATLTDSFHTGWPTTVLEVTGADTGNPQIVLSRRNRARLSDYNTLDLRVTRTFALPHGALDVFVEVNNALSRENECCVHYEVTQNPDGSLSYSRERGFVAAAGAVGGRAVAVLKSRAKASTVSTDDCDAGRARRGSRPRARCAAVARGRAARRP